jgi:hypothetical protein
LLRGYAHLPAPRAGPDAGNKWTLVDVHRQQMRKSLGSRLRDVMPAVPPSLEGPSTPVSLLGCASARGWLSLQLFAAAGASREQPARRYDNSPARIRALPAAKAPRSFRPAAVDLDEQLFDQSPRSPAAVGVVGGEASAKECPSAQGDPRRHRNSEAASRRCIPHTARRVSRSNKSGTLPLSPSATALQSPFKQAQCAVCGDGS